MRTEEKIDFQWGDWHFDFEQLVIAQFQKILAEDLKENPPELSFYVYKNEVKLQLSMLFAGGDSDKLTWSLTVDPVNLIQDAIEGGLAEDADGRVLSAALRRYADMLDGAGL